MESRLLLSPGDFVEFVISQEHPQGKHAQHDLFELEPPKDSPAIIVWHWDHDAYLAADGLCYKYVSPTEFPR